MNKRKNKTNINDQIRAKEVRVVGSGGENFGVKPIDEAIKMAKDKGLDLIEIAPQANPVVTKIYSYDKFRYEKKKEEQEEKKKKKQKETKRVQITPRSADNDLNTKAKRAEKFLKKGHKVEIFMFLKGREKANKDFAKDKLKDFLNSIDFSFKQTSDIKYTGRGFSTYIAEEQ